MLKTRTLRSTQKENCRIASRKASRDDLREVGVSNRPAINNNAKKWLFISPLETRNENKGGRTTAKPVVSSSLQRVAAETISAHRRHSPSQPSTASSRSRYRDANVAAPIRRQHNEKLAKSTPTLHQVPVTIETTQLLKRGTARPVSTKFSNKRQKEHGSGGSQGEDLSRASSISNLHAESTNKGGRGALAKVRKSVSKDKLNDNVNEKRSSSDKKGCNKNNNQLDPGDHDELQQKLESMTNEKTNLMLQLGEHKGQLSNLQMEIARLKMFQEQSSMQMEQLNDENAALRNKLRDVVHSPLSDNEKQMILLDSQRHHSSAPASIAANLLNDGGGDATTCSTPDWDKQSSSNVSEVSVACLQDKINQMQETHYSTNEELQATLQELTDLQRQLTELQQDNEHLLEEKNLMFESLCRQTERLTDARNEIESLKKLLYREKDESGQDESAAEREQKLVDLLQNAQMEREMLLVKQEQLNNEIQEARQLFGQRENDNLNLTERVRTLESTLDAKHAEHKQLDQDLARAKDKSSSRQIEIDRLTDLLENARTKIIELEQDRALSDKSELDELLDNARKEKDALESEVANLKEQLARGRNEGEKLREQVSILQEECKVLRNNAKCTQSELEYKVEMLTAEKNGLMEQLQRLEEAANELQVQSQCQLEDKRQLSSVLSETQRNMSEVERKNKELEVELKDIKKIRAEENEEWEKFQNDLLTSVRVANDFKNEAQQELQNLVLENKAHRDKIRHLEAQIEKLKDSVGTAVADVTALRKRLEDNPREMVGSASARTDVKGEKVIIKHSGDSDGKVNTNVNNVITGNESEVSPGNSRNKVLGKGTVKVEDYAGDDDSGKYIAEDNRFDDAEDNLSEEIFEAGPSRIVFNESAVLKSINDESKLKDLTKREAYYLKFINEEYVKIDPSISVENLLPDQQLIVKLKRGYDRHFAMQKAQPWSSKKEVAISKPLLASVYDNPKLKEIVENDDVPDLDSLAAANVEIYTNLGKNKSKSLSDLITEDTVDRTVLKRAFISQHHLNRDSNMSEYQDSVLWEYSDDEDVPAIGGSAPLILQELYEQIDKSKPEHLLTKEEQYVVKLKSSLDGLGRKNTLRHRKLNKNKLSISAPVLESVMSNEKLACILENPAIPITHSERNSWRDKLRLKKRNDNPQTNVIHTNTRLGEDLIYRYSLNSGAIKIESTSDEDTVSGSSNSLEYASRVGSTFYTFGKSGNDVGRSVRSEDVNMLRTREQHLAEKGGKSASLTDIQFNFGGTQPRGFHEAKPLKDRDRLQSNEVFLRRNYHSTPNVRVRCEVNEDTNTTNELNDGVKLGNLGESSENTYTFVGKVDEVTSQNAQVVEGNDPKLAPKLDKDEDFKQNSEAYKNYCEYVYENIEANQNNYRNSGESKIRNVGLDENRAKSLEINHKYGRTSEANSWGHKREPQKVEVNRGTVRNFVRNFEYEANKEKPETKTPVRIKRQIYENIELTPTTEDAVELRKKCINNVNTPPLQDSATTETSSRSPGFVFEEVTDPQGIQNCPQEQQAHRKNPDIVFSYDSGDEQCKNSGLNSSPVLFSLHPRNMHEDNADVEEQPYSFICIEQPKIDSDGGDNSTLVEENYRKVMRSLKKRFGSKGETVEMKSETTSVAGEVKIAVESERQLINTAITEDNLTIPKPRPRSLINERKSSVDMDSHEAGLPQPTPRNVRATSSPFDEVIYENYKSLTTPEIKPCTRNFRRKTWDPSYKQEGNFHQLEVSKTSKERLENESGGFEDTPMIKSKLLRGKHCYVNTRPAVDVIRRSKSVDLRTKLRNSVILEENYTEDPSEVEVMSHSRINRLNKNATVVITEVTTPEGNKSEDIFIPVTNDVVITEVTSEGGDVETTGINRLNRNTSVVITEVTNHVDNCMPVTSHDVFTEVTTTDSDDSDVKTTRINRLNRNTSVVITEVKNQEELNNYDDYVPITSDDVITAAATSESEGSDVETTGTNRLNKNTSVVITEITTDDEHNNEDNCASEISDVVITEMITAENNGKGVEKIEENCSTEHNVVITTRQKQNNEVTSTTPPKCVEITTLSTLQDDDKHIKITEDTISELNLVVVTDDTPKLVAEHQLDAEYTVDFQDCDAEHVRNENISRLEANVKLPNQPTNLQDPKEVKEGVGIEEIDAETEAYLVLRELTQNFLLIEQIMSDCYVRKESKKICSKPPRIVSSAFKSDKSKPENIQIPDDNKEIFIQDIDEVNAKKIEYGTDDVFGSKDEAIGVNNQLKPAGSNVEKIHKELSESIFVERLDVDVKSYVDNEVNIQTGKTEVKPNEKIPQIYETYPLNKVINEGRKDNMEKRTIFYESRLLANITNAAQRPTSSEIGSKPYNQTQSSSKLPEAATIAEIGLNAYYDSHPSPNIRNEVRQPRGNAEASSEAKITVVNLKTNEAINLLNEDDISKLNLKEVDEYKRDGIIEKYNANETKVEGIGLSLKNISYHSFKDGKVNFETPPMKSFSEAYKDTETLSKLDDQTSEDNSTGKHNEHKDLHKDESKHLKTASKPHNETVEKVAKIKPSELKNVHQDGSLKTDNETLVNVDKVKSTELKHAPPDESTILKITSKPNIGKDGSKILKIDLKPDDEIRANVAKIKSAELKHLHQDESTILKTNTAKTDVVKVRSKFEDNPVRRISANLEEMFLRRTELETNALRKNREANKAKELRNVSVKSVLDRIEKNSRKSEGSVLKVWTDTSADGYTSRNPNGGAKNKQHLSVNKIDNVKIKRIVDNDEMMGFKRDDENSKFNRGIAANRKLLNPADNINEDAEVKIKSTGGGIKLSNYGKRFEVEVNPTGKYDFGNDEFDRILSAGRVSNIPRESGSRHK